MKGAIIAALGAVLLALSLFGAAVFLLANGAIALGLFALLGCIGVLVLFLGVAMEDE